MKAMPWGVGLGVAMLAAAGTAHGTIVITEIFYNLAGTEGSTNEWIEIANIGPAAVDLSGWRFIDIADNQISGPFPTGTVLASGGVAVITQQPAATFQSIWGSGIQVINVTSFPSLANTPTTYTGTVPAQPFPYTGFASLFSPALTTGQEALAIVSADDQVTDLVIYDVVAPWPTGANGFSIYALPAALANPFTVTAANDLGASWGRSAIGVDGAYEALIVNPDITNTTLKDVASPGVVAGLVVIPEPSALGVVGVAGLALMRRRRA
ncbi:MAG: lamin tail domain-containing protein [Tepidisphaerales bacterium]